MMLADQARPERHQMLELELAQELVELEEHNVHYQQWDEASLLEDDEFLRSCGCAS